MQYLFLWLLSIPFLYLNYEVVLSDFQRKIIPNKLLIQLLILLPFFWWYSYIYSPTSIDYIVLQTLLTLGVSFWLYYFWLWGAGDAKYLLILSLFVLHIWIIPLISNIAFLTLLYLWLYCVYFYTFKLPFNQNYSKFIFTNIQQDIRDKLHTFLKTWSEGIVTSQAFKKTFRFFLLFLTLFVWLRLIRMYIVSEYLPKETFIASFFWEQLHNYLPLIWIPLFIFLVILSKIAYGYIRNFTSRVMLFIGHKAPNAEHVNFFYTLIAFYLLSCYILYEYFKYPEYILHKLTLIFSVYLWFFLVFVSLRYAYNVTFQIGEIKYIPFKNLQAGEIVDKPYLLQLLGNQRSPHFSEDSLTIKNIDSPINVEECKNIQKIFKRINTYHKKNKTAWFNEFIYIKVLNTFSFWVYIFWGFLLTYIFWTNILHTIVELFMHFFHIALR